jgi:hypothetical protein
MTAPAAQITPICTVAGLPELDPQAARNGDARPGTVLG